MEIPNSHLAAYTADSAARQGLSSVSARVRRPPVEQVLEGELLNDRRQQSRSSADAQRQAHERYYEQVRQVRSTSPQAAKALEAYLSNAGIDGAGFSDYPHRLDVYV